MIRQHKKMILLTSIITLFPIFIGLLLWNQLPDSLATHWGINNEPNGYASKTFAVFGLTAMRKECYKQEENIRLDLPGMIMH